MDVYSAGINNYTTLISPTAKTGGRLAPTSTSKPSITATSPSPSPTLPKKQLPSMEGMDGLM